MSASQPSRGCFPRVPGKNWRANEVLISSILPHVSLANCYHNAGDDASRPADGDLHFPISTEPSSMRRAPWGGVVFRLHAQYARARASPASDCVRGGNKTGETKKKTLSMRICAGRARPGQEHSPEKCVAAGIHGMVFWDAGHPALHTTCNANMLHTYVYSGCMLVVTA
jgi:hypothetical protein